MPREIKAEWETESWVDSQETSEVKVELERTISCSDSSLHRDTEGFSNYKSPSDFNLKQQGRINRVRRRLVWLRVRLRMLHINRGGMTRSQRDRATDVRYNIFHMNVPGALDA